MPNRVKPYEGEWITKQEAIARYPISQRNLERYMGDGRIRKKTLAREPGQRGVPPVVVNCEDLDRYKRAQEGKDAMPPPPPMARLAKKALLAIAAPVAPAAPPPRAEPPIWCTIAQAAAWSGLPPGWLKRACEAGTVVALNVSLADGRYVWRVNRDALGEAQGGFVLSAGA